MVTALGWLLLLAGIVGGIWVLRARAAAAEAAGRSGAPPAPSSRQYAAVIAGLVAGIWLIATGSGATARLSETLSTDFSKDPPPGWLINKPDAIQVTDGRLKIHLEADGGAYAIAPVDWDADAFRAEFDIQLDRRVNNKLGEGHLQVGLFDGSLADIEDVDHVGGSTIQTTFGNDIRLRVSDANLLTKSDFMSNALRGKPPVTLQPGKLYHATMAYSRRDQTASLTVTEVGGAQPLVQLKVEELRDFTPNVAYFGVSIKGYKKGKDLKPKPSADGWLDNVHFLQP